MIFVTLGSQKFQFNRLLTAIDDLVKQGIITETVFAQTGYSDYTPKNYDSRPFLDREEFAGMEGNADIIITHGGTGAIIGAVKKGKKVIAVPRLSRYGEHVDDHQLQLVTQFFEMNLIEKCMDVKDLQKALEKVKKNTYASYTSNTSAIIDSLETYIQSCAGR